MWNSNGVSLAKATEDVEEKFGNEKKNLTEDKLSFNQYSYTPTKLAKIQH